MPDDPIVKLLEPDKPPTPPERTERIVTMTITVVEYPDGSTGPVTVQGPRDNGVAFKVLELARVVIVKRVLQDANLLRGDGLLVAVPGDG